MATNTHDLGDRVRVSAVFRRVSDGEAIDPTVVSISVRDPEGVVTTKVYGTDEDVIKDSVGNYHYDVDVDQAGTWYYRWFSTGAGKAGAEQLFNVDIAKAV